MKSICLQLLLLKVAQPGWGYTCAKSDTLRFIFFYIIVNDACTEEYKNTEPLSVMYEKVGDTTLLLTAKHSSQLL